MKRGAIYLFFFFMLLAIAFAKAEPVLLLQQNTFQPGETLIGEIKVEAGEFESAIQESDIKFYEGRREIFFDYSLFPYDNKYYFFAYPNKEGNFTIKIENIIYRDIEDVLKSMTIEKNLIIKETKHVNSSDTQILSIRPGVIFSSNKNQEIVLENKGNKPINVSYKIDDQKDADARILSPLRPEKIYINLTKSFSNLAIQAYSSFSVPLIYTGISPNIQTNQSSLKINPLKIQIKANKGKEARTKLEFFNFENITISSLAIKKNIPIISFTSFPSQIKGGESLTINLSFFSSNLGKFQDNLTITYGENKIKKVVIIPVEIYVFSENESLDNVSLIPDKNAITCAQKGGIICIGECSGSVLIVSDGLCCIGGQCTPQKDNVQTDSGYSWLWGIIILVALGIAGFFIYKKVKATKSKPAEKIIADKTKIFEKRVSGEISRS